MENCPAPSLTTCEFHFVLLHTIRFAFAPRVLRTTNHDGIGVTPQKQHTLIGGHRTKNRVFDGEVKPRVRRIREQNASLSHGCCVPSNRKDAPCYAILRR
ncbi:Uncharacterised protein [Vibrio cholerae]|nr:Uncharacterised protein [Vibrio cholerae]CSB55178.1 Uncharacterised protein [Vibrio cholerae]CSC66576.1 Uncharacterised protein [Vibrio cholerae]